MEAAGAGRGAGEAVGGGGLRGWGRVVAGLVGTAGSSRGGKFARVSVSPSDDRPLSYVFPGLVADARCARVGLAIADCTRHP